MLGGFFVAVIVALGFPAFAEISSRGEPTWGVYSLDTDTETDSIRSLVWAIEQIGDRVYVGGKFLEVRQDANGTPVSQPYLAAFDAKSGKFIADFRPVIDGAVYSLQASPDGTRLFVGGEFASVDGDNETRALAAIDPNTGMVDKAFRAKATQTSGAKAIVMGMTVSGQHLYLAGRFNQVGGGPRPKLATDKVARVSLADGTADQSLAPKISGGSVWGVAVAPDGSKIFLAGAHDSVDGDSRGADYSVLSASDGSLIGAQSDIGGNSSNKNRWYGQDVVAVGDHVFWGGSQHILQVFRISDGALVRQHSTDYGGDYQDLEVVGDRVYASCHCYTNHYADHDWWADRKPSDAVAVNPIRYVAAYSAVTGGHLPSFALDASAAKAGVWAIHGDPDSGCLWVGGDVSRITTVGGTDRATGGFAQFCPGQGGDSRAPDIPGDLTQTRSENRKIVVRWNPSDDNLGTTRYEVRRDGTIVGEVKHGYANHYWFTDPGLEPKTVYEYEVVAIDGADNRSSAAVVRAATLGAISEVDEEAPTRPGDLTQTRSEKHKIVVRFDASSDNVSVDHYQVLRNSTPVGTISSTSANRYWYTDTGLDPGVEYNYEVVAVDGAANRSTPATIVAATSGASIESDTEPPSQPGDPSQTRSENTKVVISFSASTDNVSVDRYEIIRDGKPAGTKPATSANRYWYTATDLARATNYHFEIVAVDGAGNRSPATLITAGTTGAPAGEPPPAPGGLRSTLQTRERIVLKWESVIGADEYVVMRRTGDSDWETISTKGGVWYTDPGLGPATEYVYQVVAINGMGPSAPSPELSVSTLP